MAKFGARGVMPPGFAVGTRVRTSLAGRAKGINQRHPTRLGTVRGASSDGTCVYVRWDGNVANTMRAYLAAYLEQLTPEQEAEAQRLADEAHGAPR